MSYVQDELDRFRKGLLKELNHDYWLIPKEGKIVFWSKLGGYLAAAVFVSGLITWGLVENAYSTSGAALLLNQLKADQERGKSIVEDLKSKHVLLNEVEYDPATKMVTLKTGVTIVGKVVLDNNLQVNGSTHLNEDFSMKDTAGVKSKKLESLIDSKVADAKKSP